MSNYSDLHNQMLSYQSLGGAGHDAGSHHDPELEQDRQTTRYLENRNLQQVAVLTENEMRVLCQLSPNQSGVIISIIIAYALSSTLAMFETALMPIITQADLVDSQIDSHYGYPLLTCISVTTAVSYYVFRRFIVQNQASMPQLSDRSFIFISLLLAIVGSSLLINYKDVGPLTTIGLTVLGMSLVIGVKSIIDLYAKLIGVSSLLGETLGTSTNPDDNLHIQQHSLPQRKSVGWYLGLAALFSVLFRVATPQITSYLLLHGGASAIFWQTLCVNCLTLLIFLLKFDSL